MGNWIAGSAGGAADEAVGAGAVATATAALLPVGPSLRSCHQYKPPAAAMATINTTIMVERNLFMDF